MLPAPPSLRATFSSASISSGEASALSDPLAATAATPPASSGPMAMSGRSICFSDSETGSEKAPSSACFSAPLGSRATSIRSAKIRSARKVFENSASGDQSTATPRPTSQVPSLSPIARLSSVSSPVQMPSMPRSRTDWSGVEMKSEISPARLSRPRSVSVNTRIAPKASASTA